MIPTGFWSLIEKEIARYVSVWSQTIMGPVLSAALYIVIFGVSLSPVLGGSYFTFLVTGLVAMTILNNAINNTAASIMTSKFHNDLQDLKLIPVSAFWVSSAYVVAAVVRALFCGLCVYVVGSIFHWYWDGQWVGVESPLIFLFFSITSSIFFACIGIWAAFRCSSFDQLNTILQFVIMPLTYLGGIFFSIEKLSPFFQLVAKLNPIFYMINGIRFGFGDHQEVSIGVCVAATLFSTVLAIVLAAWGVSKGSYTRF